MNVLVTGGAGFIGSHLVDRLLNDNNKVTVISGHSDKIIVIDDFSHGKYVNLHNDPRLTVIDTNILGNIGHLFKGIDVVFHLAALTRPQWSIKYPFETTEINVGGTVKILEHCRDNNVKRIVFMSSSNLYGDQEIYPTPEDVTPNPMNTYALSKWVGEEYCKLFNKLYGLEWNACRPFNAYGTRMPLTGIYTSAVASFIDCIKNNSPIEIWGTGEQRRDFIYIDDIIDQLIMMATSKVSGEAFNCGSGTNNSINEIYNCISQITGKQVEIKRSPAQFEPKSTLANITKAEKLLGWKPKVNLQEGLRRTIGGSK